MQGAGCRVQGAGCRVQVAGCRVQGAGCRVQVAGCRVQGSGRVRQRVDLVHVGIPEGRCLGAHLRCFFITLKPRVE